MMVMRCCCCCWWPPSSPPKRKHSTGVIGQGVEANIAKPGTVDFPNPSEQLLQKVNVETVTTDGDVASADGADSMPR